MRSLNPLVSIVIPAYNQARYLHQSIDSALAQTYKLFEIIVVDDGSTDDTPLVASQFSGRINYIRQDNQGLGSARNTGIRNSNGHFIALLDSDDQWLPNYLEKMEDLTDRFPEAVVYYCQARCMDVDGHDLPRVLGGPVKSPEKIYQTLLRSNFLIPSTILMNRSVVLEVGLFDQSLRSCEDWDLWLRLLPEHKFIGSDNCLVKYRLHNASLSTNLEGMHKAARSVIEKNFGSEDGDPNYWTLEKRRAYGGLYRYQASTSILRQDNWQVASQLILRGLRADPTLSLDLGLFYDLALGSQPVGLRGTSYQVDLQANAMHISQMLVELLKSPVLSRNYYLRNRVYGSAYFALGLVGYNTGHYALCRKFMFMALRFRPDLWQDKRVLGSIVKSFLGFNFINLMRRLIEKKT